MDWETPGKPSQKKYSPKRYLEDAYEKFAVYRTARRVWMWHKPHDKLRLQVVMEGDVLKRL